MASFDRQAGPTIRFETESWDNYTASRRRILEHVKARGIDNVVSLAGNIHAFYGGVVSEQTREKACEHALMTEIVTTSVSALGGRDKRYQDVHGRRGENPCLQYFDNRYRGYALVNFSRLSVEATLRNC